MSGFTDQARANTILGAISGANAFPSYTGSPKLLLGSTAPTSTVRMTELPNGGGYTTGGQAFTWGSPSGAVITGPASAVTWANASGSAWTVSGGEETDSAGTPLRWKYWTWTGAPVTVPNGSNFQVAANAMTADGSGW